MQKLTDKELINQAAGFSCGCDKCLARVEPPRMELLARLERGRIAIEAMEKIAKARLEDDYDEFAADVDLILRKYQQSKEDTDGRL